MKKEDILTIGSTIFLKGNSKPVMIIGRAMLAQLDNQQYYFDYMGCLYPEGIVDEESLYFQASEIAKVIHEADAYEGEDVLKDAIMEVYETNKNIRYTPKKEQVKEEW